MLHLTLTPLSGRFRVALLLFVASLLLLMPASAWAQETWPVSIAERVQAGSSADGWRVLLSNGLEVLLLPDPTSRLVTSIVVIRGGAASETPHSSGASHFLEHMLFNGTTRRTQKQLYDDVDYYAAFNNAFTRRTHAAFMMTVPSAYMGRGLDIQSDMLFNSSIPDEKFEKERGIILEELAKDRESESYELQRLLQAETYPASSYGLPVLGTERSIREMDRQTVWDFYQRQYVPERMAAVLIGGFDPAAAVDSLERTLGASASSGEPFRAPPPPRPIVTTRTARYGLPLSRSHLRLVWNGPDPECADFLAAEAATDLLMGNDASPLAQALRTRFPGVIHSCQGWIEAGPGFGRLVVDLDLEVGTPLEELREVLLERIQQLESPDRTKLEAWKVARRAGQLSARQRSFMYAPFCSEELALGGPWRLRTAMSRIRALSHRELVEAVQQLGQGPSWAILVEAIPLNEKPLVTEVEVVSPQTDVDPYAVEQRTLANGSNLLLLPVPSNGLLSIYILIEGRNYLEPSGQEGITELVHQMIELGPRGMDETAFDEALAQIGGELQAADRAFLPFDDYYTRRDFSFVRFQALEEHADRAFALLGTALRQPRFGQEALERLRGRTLARLAREESSGRRLGREKLTAMLVGPGHPAGRSAFGNAASVGRLTLHDLNVHHKRLLDPRRIWIAVASSLPAQKIVQWAEALLPEAGSDPSPTLGMTPERYALWLQREHLGEQAAENLQRASLACDRLRVPSAAENTPGDADLKLARPPCCMEFDGGGERGYVLEALLWPPMSTANPPVSFGESALRVAVRVLSSRLAFRMREQKGMAYGIGASLDRIGDRFLYVAAAGTRAQNVEQMAFGLAAGRSATHPLESPDEARRAANTLYGSFLRRQESRLNQAMQAVWMARLGKDPLAWWHRAEEVQQVAPSSVERALRALAEADSSVVIIVR